MMCMYVTRGRGCSWSEGTGNVCKMRKSRASRMWRQIKLPFAPMHRTVGSRLSQVSRHLSSSALMASSPSASYVTERTADGHVTYSLHPPSCGRAQYAR
jgi:hypothetical protein